MALQPYALPLGPHTRRHGPFGYVDYGTYKIWLRDEFPFRCVFCLHREKWERRGWRIFHVDHIIPQSVDQAKVCDYENLLYLCDACNESKSDWVIPDPCVHDYSADYRFGEDGTAVPISDFGDLYIKVLKLNEPHLVEYRRDFLREIREFEKIAPDLDDDDLIFGLKRWFGYPADAPDLRRQKPKGNTRPGGKHETYYLKLQENRIEPFY
jgi:hypothetical protein